MTSIAAMPTTELAVVSAAATRPLVEVEDLSVKFVSREATVSAVNGVSFSIMPGEVLCIIGESGSGKSVTMRALMRLLPKGKTKIDGHMRVGEHDILKLTDRELTHIRGSTISMIFQEPMTALDPVYTIGHQIAETVVKHEGCSYADGLKRGLELLEFVKVPSPERRLKAYLRRFAPARDDRHGLVLPAAAPACRRTDNRSGRHGADSGSGSLAQAPAGYGHERDLRHA
jgi:peptide/nickel transport system ATP-binding protein